LDTANKKQSEEISQIMEKNVKIWEAEKITVIHNIDQQWLTNLTYKDSFNLEWKYDVIKMLLVNLLKNTFILDMESKLGNDVDLKANCSREKIMELFKKECFKSGKVKNQLLYIDNFKLDLDDTYNVYFEGSIFSYKYFLASLDEATRRKYAQDVKEYMTLSKAYKYFHYKKDLIYKQHEEQIKNKDKEFINVWIPLLCTIQEILALSVAQEKIKDKENNVIAKVLITK